MIVNIHWLDKLANKELSRKTDQEPVTSEDEENDLV